MMTERVRLRSIEKDKAKQEVFKKLRSLSGQSLNDASIKAKDVDIADEQRRINDARALRNTRDAYQTMVILFSIVSFLLLTLLTAAIMWYYCQP
jgi:hypothetical protein